MIYLKALDHSLMPLRAGQFNRVRLEGRCWKYEISGICSSDDSKFLSDSVQILQEVSCSIN